MKRAMLLTVASVMLTGAAFCQNLTPAQIKRRDAWLVGITRADKQAARTLDSRYSLGQRRQMAWEMCRGEDMAHMKAKRTFSDDQFMKQAGLSNELQEQADARFARKYHLTQPERLHLMQEASTGNWPTPPPPKGY